MNKLFILLVFSVGINATAQVATSGTTNSGTNASAIGYQSSATNTVSTAMGRETLASGITSYSNGLSNLCNKYRLYCNEEISSTASGVTSTAIRQ